MKRIYGILSVLLILTFVFGSFVSGADETLVDTLVPETQPTPTPEETKNELPSLEKVGVAALYDVESMTRIYDKNSEVKTAPALTAKMMVALVVIEELEGELALKNDPLKMEQLAKELGMVRGEYVQTRLLQTEQEEHVVVYAEEEHQTISLATLLSAIGFFKN